MGIQRLQLEISEAGTTSEEGGARLMTRQPVSAPDQVLNGASRVSGCQKCASDHRLWRALASRPPRPRSGTTYIRGPARGISLVGLSGHYWLRSSVEVCCTS